MEYYIFYANALRYNISEREKKKDTIQNFQFSRVRARTYSSNISFILLVLCLETGAPVAGSID